MKNSFLVLLLLVLLAAACSSDDEVLNTTVTPDRSFATDATATATAHSSDSLEVGDLFDGEGARDATVVGAVLWDGSGARLCAALMESFPPQCGDPWVTIANPEVLEVDLEVSGPIRWTQAFVELNGHFDGDRLILGTTDDAADHDGVEPTLADQALVDAFVGFSADPSIERINQISFADTVALGLGDEIMVTLPADTLVDPQNWTLDRDEFRAWSGPFSALWLVDGPVTITVGSHPRCAAPPMPAPTGFADHRRLSLQPETATSCLEWWTIDFFIDDDGNVGALTLDLFAP